MKRNTCTLCEDFEVCHCMHTYQDCDIQNVDILYRGVGSDCQVHRTYFLLQEIVYITYRIIQIIQFNCDTV